jgi:hypothetical protein
MQQRLHLLAQGAHALQVAQHSQADKIRHAQHSRYRVGTAYLRQGTSHRRQQFPQDGLIHEAIHDRS